MHFQFDDGRVDTVYVGSPDDIKALYKSMCRAYRKGKADACPCGYGHMDENRNLVDDFPTFNPRRAVYGLTIDQEINQMFIVGQDTIAQWMFEMIPNESFRNYN